MVDENIGDGDEDMMDMMNMMSSGEYLPVLRDAAQGSSRMIAEVPTYRMGCMEVTFTQRGNPGRGHNRNDPKLRYHCIH